LKLARIETTRPLSDQPVSDPSTVPIAPTGCLDVEERDWSEYQQIGRRFVWCRGPPN